MLLTQRMGDKSDMKTKVFSILAIFLLTAGILGGCGPKPAVNESLKTNTAAQSTAGVSNTAASGGTAQTSATDGKATVYPLTLKDAKGTAVTINQKPVKIASMPLGTCEMLLSLADKSQIAAMTNYVDDPVVSNVADAAKGVGERLDFNAEKLIALQPDLVLVDAWSDANIVKQLRDSNIKVFVLQLPANVNQQKEMLKLLGTITDSAAKAEDVISWMDQKLKAVSDKLSGIKEEQKLTIIDYSEMGSTSGKDTNFDDVVTRAGLINPVAKEGLTGWPELSKEMIVKFNPDIISIPSWFYDTSKATPESMAKAIKGDKALAGVKAVKNNKIISIPYNHLSTTSHYSVLAVEDMAKAVYPELFK